ncbi:hypothetical protein N2152v2_009836 [Parachlorella kessleri]
MQAAAQAASFFLLAAVLSQQLPAAAALSFPLCERGGQVWVTEHPRRNARFPGADLYYFCHSGLNVLGDSLDPCLNQGSLCTQAVTDAICKLLGYDRADGPSTSVRAHPGEVVRILTGEYCLREGTYYKTLPGNLAAMPGRPCLRIDAISCIRSLRPMAGSVDHIQDAVAAVEAKRDAAPPCNGPAAAPGFPKSCSGSERRVRHAATREGVELKGQRLGDRTTSNFCDGALNILGDSVDPCIMNGTLCDSAVTDAICKFLGYDHAYQGATLRQAKPDEVVRSLTGEYCLREGTYSTTLPADIELKTLPGKPCMRVEQLTCIRTVEHMAGDLQNIVWELALNSSSAPQAEPAPSEDNVTLPVRAAEAAP